MASSLNHERPLVISPTLAATIGLEEALLLQFLHEFTQLIPGEHHGQWREITKAELLRLLPFWNERDCQRVSTSLREKGVLWIDSPPLEQSACLRFCLDASQPRMRVPQQPAFKASAGKSLIAGRWQPDEELLRQLALHGISREFAAAQLDEFVLYWSDRGDPAFSWNAKFRGHVIRRWREHEAANEDRDDLPNRIGPNWKPDTDALEILQRAGVSRNFIEDAVPEFVLYWTERGEAARTWNSRFVAHVKRQWARYTATMELDSEPRRIPANWQPSADVHDILRMANIDEAFALALLPEFQMYWSDSGEACPSWNSKFLQHVKYHWARSHQPGKGGEDTNENRKGSGAAGSTRTRSLIEDLTDRSWAD
ncbi:MAG: hypothetical protein KBG75_02325 [Pseudomonadales bacterium]|nr:hypothetical protein [Pseudomonadales bacterium]